MKKKVLLWVHIAYWLYVFVFVEFFNMLAYKNKLMDLSTFFNPISISNYLLFMGVFYLNYLLLPVLFKKKKFLLIVAGWFLIASLFVALRYFVQEYLMLKYWGICNYCYSDYGKEWGIYVVNNFFQCISYFILPGAIIWFADNWFRSETQKVQLQKEKVNAERAFLQSQISPHFLFNSLNNIYSMVFHHSENSLTAIQKLSNIMRYMTTESSAESISLSREIDYLKDYIQLQAYRSRSTAINFVVEGDPGGEVIAPLILISFVENAFKHGVTNDPENPVNISLRIESGNLRFMAENKINHSSKDATSGVGLVNIRSRLSLQYPGKHTLEIKEEENTFTVNLLLTLKMQLYDKVPAGR